MTHRALIPIPQNVDPVDTRCIQFTVPLDSEWVGMFFGALYQLTAWNSYDRDDDHTAKDIADRWKTIVEDARGSECGESMSITFRQTDCLLEYSLDSGATWETAYDGMDCLTAAIAGGVVLGGSALDDAIASGKISPGQQQGPTSAPGLGFCKDFYVSLSANQKWICPVPINGNFTITIESVVGGWTDDPSSGWWCPDGKNYILGQCVNSTESYDGSDPLTTAYHMRLIGYYGSTFFDAYNTTYLVPASVTTDQQLFLQPNDSDISNNLGSVTFHITVCKATWEHVWDFTIDDGGWSAFTSPITRAAYVAGRGWHRAHETDDYSDRVTFYINTPGSVNVTMTYMQAQVETCTGVNNIGLYFAGVNPYVGCADDMGEYTHQGNANQLLIDAVMSRPNDCYIHKVIIRGLGVDPWA